MNQSLEGADPAPGRPTGRAGDTRERIGLAGVGLMGSVFGQLLLASGFAVTGYDTDPQRRECLHSMGGTPTEYPNDIALCRRILLSLPNHEVVETVLGQMGAALKPGQVIIDTTTGSPESAVRLGARLAAQGVAYLDATISGNSAQLKTRDVIVMAGGPEEAFAQCRDLFEVLARRSFYLGPWGSGAKLKLVTNLVLGLNRAALAEGLSLARALGIDGEQALGVLSESAAYSRVMEIKGRKMVEGSFEPVARLSQHLKDVRLILEAGAAAGRELPLSTVHKQLLERAESMGLGELDNSAIIQVWEQRAVV